MAEPQQVGRYRLVKRIAAGGMGEVHLATVAGPEGFEKVVVVKRMLPSMSADRNVIRLFLDEARLVAKLSHRNIAQIFELGEDSGGFYVAMEFVRGPSLRRILSFFEEGRDFADLGQRIPPVLAIDIVAQVAEALAYAFSAQADDGTPLHIVHRDVTPENILVSTAGDVKLIDFGVAKSVQQQHSTEAGTVKGKLAYMSPEQSRGEPLDGRSDIFSLGIVLCELLTGRNPFNRGEVIPTVLAIQKDPPELPSQVDPTLAPCDAVIKGMLAKNASDRYPDCYRVAEELMVLRTRLPPSPLRLGPFIAENFRQEIASLVKSVSDPEARKAMRADSGLNDLFTPSSAGQLPSASDRKFGDLSTNIRTPGSKETVEFGPTVTRKSGEFLEAAPGATSYERAPSSKRRQPIPFVIGGVAVVAAGIGLTVYLTRSGNRTAVESETPPVTGPVTQTVPTPPPTAAEPAPTQTPPKPATVKLSLISDPANAEVYDGDALLGRTPLMIDWGKGRRADLRFVLSGYVTQSKAIEPMVDTPLLVKLVKPVVSKRRGGSSQANDIKSNPFE
jgi:eukaryotic-like serine/threonine-protein kinase